ncbi:MAG: hypothetical protein QXU18_14885 [Thermoplasmatales archaeon]
MAEFNGLKNNKDQLNSFHDPKVSVKIDRIIIMPMKKGDIGLGRKMMLQEKLQKIRKSKRLSKRKTPPIEAAPEASQGSSPETPEIE